MIPRHEWGAIKPLPGGALVPPMIEVVFHHAPERFGRQPMTMAQEVAALRIIDGWHVNHNGWADFAYNFAVSPSGRVYEGRGWLRSGAHTGNAEANRRALGILLMIDGDATEGTEDMWAAVRALLREGVARGGLHQTYTVSGHQKYKNTACPGRRVLAVMQDRVVEPSPKIEISPEEAQAVRTVLALLRRIGEA